jgi:trimethylguanosine synthase
MSDECAQMAALGLPTAFASSKHRNRSKKHKGTFNPSWTLVHHSSPPPPPSTRESGALFYGPSAGLPPVPLSSSSDCADLDKYWAQRHRLFSRYDDGVWLEDDAWFSATPEVISAHIAGRLGGRGVVAVDACCGAGGNTVQLALRCSLVIAIDCDSARLAMAQHNCAIYGVSHKVEFILGDVFAVLPLLSADVVFVGPPWGGPEYSLLPEFPLSAMPMDVGRLFRLAGSVSTLGLVAAVLPRNVCWRSVLDCWEGEVELEANVLDSKLKLCTAYLLRAACTNPLGDTFPT